MPGLPVHPQEAGVVAGLSIGILERRKRRALPQDRQAEDEPDRLEQPPQLLGGQRV